MSKYRKETDSLGELFVPIERYWGAQTQRSIENFPIGNERFPPEFIRAMGIIKLACADVNQDLGLITPSISKAIVLASKEVIEGKFNSEFPLVIWQTGSGTQTNMNVNEVIANRASEILGAKIGSKKIHPNDHVNRSQSSNDVFPTAMHISTVEKIHYHLLPSLNHFLMALKHKQEEFKDIVKTGRTHLQDATPVTFGQVFSGYITQIENGISRINNTLPHLFDLAIGGTAVGTGLNSHPEFATRVAHRINQITQLPFKSSKNKFEGIAAHDAIVEASSAVKIVAISLMKIANDLRWLGSGPRTGLGELILPNNEPGSSIMPGKINPTQAEAVTQVAVHIIGNDTTISIAGSQGNFELNVFKPVMIYNLLQSIQLLGDVAVSFANRCIDGLKVNHLKIQHDLEQNLMLVTGLTPIIGYEKAAEIAHKAYLQNKTLKEIILEENLIKEKELDKILDPRRMTHP